MDDFNRRKAMHMAATTGAVTAGAVVLGGNAHAAQQEGQGASGYGYSNQEATREEEQALERFLQNQAQNPAFRDIPRGTLPIPYAFTIGAVNVVGVFYLRDPIESSSTEGAVAGAINGTYNLDRDNADATFYDPTGSLLKLELNLNFQERRLRARLCSRTFTGWKCSDWKTLVSW